MERLEEAKLLASLAVNFDRSGCVEAAVYYYKEAVVSLNIACSQLPEEEKHIWRLKAKEYNQRVDFLQTPREVKREKHDPSLNRQSQCKFLFHHALDADKKGDKEEAIAFYIQAVDFCLSAKEETKDEGQKTKLMLLAKNALDRAEELKGIRVESMVKSTDSTNFSDDTSRASSSHHVNTQKTLYGGIGDSLKVSGALKYTEEEKKVLEQTSRINKLEFVPFMSVDLSEKFNYPIPFTDKDGYLALSPKQKNHFSHWARPCEIFSKPKIIQSAYVDCFSIKQTIVSDCSFVASLAVSANYENKFRDRKRLITSIIYPRNRNNEPIYNPFGKYMVKLKLNGISRKVIIDDYLPIGRHNELLCSFSLNRDEIWISLLEKAYMKVMGGYDFPGSNSNIDLYALTGWIPERVAIRSNETTFNSEDLFEMLFQRLHKGHVLATVATGDITENEAERAGLVPTHAYALLDIRKINGIKLLQLKNPWSHVRWKGNYSELDIKHWTPEIQKALKFDPSSAAQFDNGVFWIDYDSILHYFDVFYLNWDPGLFKYTYTTHQSWSAGIGPSKDLFNLGENPQFKLSLSSSQGCSIWVLLTRHITEIEDFKTNQEYITVLVYKNKGKRVYYPSDPYLNGVRINSPHYLAKIILKDPTVEDFTLVVSQYEKTTTIFYSLRVYATCPFQMEKIIDKTRFKKKITGKWEGSTAGGCRNYQMTYKNNPSYKMVVKSKLTSLIIDLKGPKEYQIGFEVTSLGPGSFVEQSTGAYRSGFTILELEGVPEGSYKVVPTTFYPKQESHFFLTFKSSSEIDVFLFN